MADKEEDILKESRDRMTVSISSWEVNRKLAEEDIDFLSGDQWPDDVKKDRKSEKKACLTFNKLPGVVDQIVGDQRQNSPSIKVRAVTPNLKPMNSARNKKEYESAEVFNGLIKNIESTSNAEHAYDTAFECAVNSGFGWFRVVTEYADDDVFEQDIVIKRIRNQFSVYPGNFTEPDGSDMMHCHIVEEMTKDEFERLYPGKRTSDVESGRSDQYSWWFEEETVRIAEYFRKVPVKKTIVKLSDGRIMDADEVEKNSEEPDMLGISIIKEREVSTFKVEWYKLSGSDILEGPREIATKYIPVIPVLGKELFVRGYPTYRGAIRHAKDPQRAYNYNRTASIEQVALAPKAPYMLGTSQIGAYASIWKKANTQNHAFLPYDDSKNPTPPQRIFGSNGHVGFATEAQMDSDDIKATTGIFDASLGAQGNETSGRAIIARDRQGDVGSFAFVDNLSRSIMHCGRIVVDMIPRIYDTERVIRVLFSDGSEDYININGREAAPDGQMQKINDLTVGKYDVTVDVGPSYTTQRVEAADAMMTMTQGNPQLWGMIGDLILKNMDWPGADDMAERMRKTMPPGMVESEDDEPEPPQPPSPEEQVAMLEAKADEQAAQAKMMKADADMMEASLKMAELKTQYPDDFERLAYQSGANDAMDDVQYQAEESEAKAQIQQGLMDGSIDPAILEEMISRQPEEEI